MSFKTVFELTGLSLLLSVDRPWDLEKVPSTPWLLIAESGGKGYLSEFSR